METRFVVAFAGGEKGFFRIKISSEKQNYEFIIALKVEGSVKYQQARALLFHYLSFHNYREVGRTSL
jgi:hypothetical protein